MVHLYLLWLLNHHISVLCAGFTFGFPLHFRGDRISFFATNLISTQQNPEIVSAKISKELAAGRLPDLSIPHLFLIFVFHLWGLYLKKLLGNIV